MKFIKIGQNVQICLFKIETKEKFNKQIFLYLNKLEMEKKDNIQVLKKFISDQLVDYLLFMNLKKMGH